MLVVYEGADEVIVCEKKLEKKIIKDFFSEGGRDLEEYERREVGSYCSFTTRIKLDEREIFNK
jgi:hypothetical protein